MIWRLFEDPKSSVAARLLNLASMLAAVLSICSMVLRTLPELRKPQVFLRLVHIHSLGC